MVVLIIILAIILILLLIAIISLLCLFRADIIYWLKSRSIKKIDSVIETTYSDIDSFKRELMLSSIKMIETGRKKEYPTLTSDTFLERFRRERNNPIDTAEVYNFEWSECGWLLWALWEDGHYSDFISNEFKTNILQKPFRIIDSSQCGMVAIGLYLKTNEFVYKDYADKMYKWINSQDTEFGILYREHDKFELVDVVGMAIPFLVYYGKIFNNDEAINLAYKTTEKYIQHGCDFETGIPVFKYSISSPYIKSGAADWGRGVAWFVIGLAYLDEQLLSEESRKIVSKLNMTLLSQWKKERAFGHFIGQGGRDLSAELPIVYYMLKKGLIMITEEDILDYSSMCHSGIMYRSSSSNVGIIKYGTLSGPNVLSQAYMIRLLTNIKK